MKLQRAAEGFFVNKTCVAVSKEKGKEESIMWQNYAQQKIFSRGAKSAVLFVEVGGQLELGDCMCRVRRSVEGSLEIIELRRPQRNARQILSHPHPSR